jgi:predicted nucleotidyltransferase
VIQPHEYEALRDFANVANDLKIPFVLIGAGARLMVLDWENNVLDQRSTEDWDFGVQLPDWNAFQLLRKKLTETGLFRKCRVPHRLEHRSNIMVDFVPFGAIEDPDGEIRWEGEGKVMNVAGFKEAMQHAVPKQLDAKLVIPVVNIPGFIILKMFAFNDRSGNQQEKDLQDIHYVLQEYHQGNNAERAFEDLMPYWRTDKVAWETAGAFLLGKDVAGMLLAETYEQMLPILDALCDENSLRSHTLARTRGVTEEDAVKRRKSVNSLFKAFRTSLVDHFQKQ